MSTVCDTVYRTCTGTKAVKIQNIVVDWYIYCVLLKGKSHDKVVEIRVCGCSLSLTKNSYWFLNFSDRPFKSCDLSTFPFYLKGHSYRKVCEIIALSYSLGLN
jgi:hypothetical protein